MQHVFHIGHTLHSEYGKELPYYKIKESFRDTAGRVHTRLMLTAGYLPDLSGDDIPPPVR